MEEMKWLLGILVTAAFAIIGYGWKLTNMITTGDNALHERINKTRDEYVRRIDLDAHLVRQDKAISELKAEIREFAREMKQAQDHTNSRLDVVLSKLSDRSN